MISITQLFIFTVRLLFQFGILVSEEKKTPVKIFDQSVINNIVKISLTLSCVTLEIAKITWTTFQKKLMLNNMSGERRNLII